jgi:hypothetical protein
MIDGTATITDWLQQDIDEWTRRIIRRHFDPETGSPYWLKKAAGLDFDPRDIRRYDELPAFGPFRLQELRELDPADLVPLAHPRPLAGRVFDSGGTTGDPCRVFYSEAMTMHRGLWRQWSFAREGFERGRAWLQMTPTGPHLIGNGVWELSELYDSRVYLLDADPRWVKRLIRAGRLKEADEYTDHLVEQAVNILRSQPIDYVNATPALFQALSRKAPDAVDGLKGIRVSGTQITASMYRTFVKLLDGGIVGHSYGNTFGSSAGLPVAGDGALIPYLPNYPQVTIAVTDKEDWQRIVGFGELGRVRLTVLHDDLFLPNILERDQALRFDTGPEWPCDGVANVRPLQLTRSAPEGIY